MFQHERLSDWLKRPWPPEFFCCCNGGSSATVLVGFCWPQSGVNNGKATYLYTPPVDAWVQGNNSTTSQNGADSFVLAGQVHAVCSRSGSSVHERYDVLGTWTNLTAITGTIGTLVQKFSNKITVSGTDYGFNAGGGNGSYTQAAWKWDISDTWTSLTSLPSPGRGLGMEMAI